MAILFFELLQVALGTRDKLSRVSSDVQWKNLLEESFRQAITGVMLCGIDKLPKEQKPSIDLLLEWIGETQIIEETAKLHQQRTRELSAMFHAVGFRSCVLKGMAIARYYPQPLRRQCGDIDLWTFGRRRDVMLWLRSQYEIGHLVWHNVGVKVFEDVPVEVHFHPAWVYNPFRNYRLQYWFKKMAERKCEEDGLNVMSVEFDAVFSLVHTYRHFLVEGVGLRHIVDYFYILERLHTENTEITEILTTLRRFGMMKFAGAMMYVMKRACGAHNDILLCKPNEKEGKFLLEEIMAAGNFGHDRIGAELKTNSLRRYAVMIMHYPGDVVWMIPWKIWHKCWRVANK